MAAAWRGLEKRLAADASLKAEVEALRVSILAAARVSANADPTLRQLALAALDQVRIAETEVARCGYTPANLLAALEARGQATNYWRKAAHPRAPACGRIDGCWVGA